MATVQLTRARPLGSSPPGRPPTSNVQLPEVTVAFAPVKGDRPEWVVQKLVEIGVDRIVVLRSARSVVVWEGDGRSVRSSGFKGRRSRRPRSRGEPGSPRSKG